MTSQLKGQPLPKFGDWDVNNPSSAAGYTVIFNKARDEKKANDSATPLPPPTYNNEPNPHQSPKNRRKKNWLCCF